MPISIKEEIAYRGCNPNPKVIVPSKELISISNLISMANLEEHLLPKERLREVLKSSRNFLNSMYDLHYVPSEIIKKKFIFSLECTGNINPYSLPIFKIETDDDFYGCLKEILSAEEEIKIIFRGIELPKNPTKITSLSYTHEITHTQLNHMRGLIREYYNTEVLSVFNELLHAYYTKDNEVLLREHDARRLKELAFIIDFLNTKDENNYNIERQIEGSCYCESTLKAYNLFIRYYFGTESIRKHIIKSIQRVIDGEITLEEILDSLDITFENSQDIKRFTKYLKR